MRFAQVERTQEDINNPGEMAFVCQDEEVDEITMVSTADDSMVKFRIASDVTVPPNKLTKVHHTLHEGVVQCLGWCIRSSFAGKGLPEGIKMDNALVDIS